MVLFKRLKNYLANKSHCTWCGNIVSFKVDASEDGLTEDTWCDRCDDFVDVWIAPLDRLKPLNY